MAYNENKDRVFLLTLDSYRFDNSWTNFNYYILRSNADKEDGDGARDPGGRLYFEHNYSVGGIGALNSAAWEVSNGKGSYVVTDRSTSDVAGMITADPATDEFFGLVMGKEGDTVTIGFNSGGMDDNKVITVKSKSLLDALTSAVHFKGAGIIDFANATGHIRPGDDVKLEISTLSASHTNQTVDMQDSYEKYLDLISSSEQTDVSTLISDSTLTVEGSLHANLIATSTEGNFKTLYSYVGDDGKIYRTDSPNSHAIKKDQVITSYNLTSDIRVLTTGVRASGITVENNMSGSINATTEKQTVSSYDTTVLTGNVFQSVGMLTNAGTRTSGVAIGTGDLVINGIWTGSLESTVSGITVGSEIFKVGTGNKVTVDEYAKKNTGKFGKVLTFTNTSAVDKVDEVGALVDPDFVPGSNTVDVSNHSFVSLGLNGNKIEMGGMVDNTTITAKISDITLRGEYAYIGEFKGWDFEKQVNLGTLAPYLDKNYSDKGKFEQSKIETNSAKGDIYKDNKVLSSAIDAKDLIINGTTNGKLISTVDNLSTVTDRIVYSYKKTNLTVLASEVGPRQAKDAPFNPENCYYEKNGKTYLLGDLIKITDPNTQQEAYYYELVERTINLTQNNNNKFADVAYTVEAYGINVSGSMTVNGNYWQEIEVSASNANTVTTTLIGINADKLTVTDGLFMGTVTVTRGENINFTTTKGHDIIGVKVDELHGEAFGGSITVEDKLQYFYGYGCTGIYVGDFVSTTGDSGAFDIIGDITSPYIAIGGQEEAWNLRIAGNIKGQYILRTDLESPYTRHDKIELAAGANLEGDMHFMLGQDTLIIDSNARMKGNIAIGSGAVSGTLNVIFNLNDYTLRNEDHKIYSEGSNNAILEGKFTTSAGTGQISPILYSVNLNDVVLGENEKEKTYALMSNQTEEFIKALKTIELKYDGISLKTEGLVAEVGYYDGDVWKPTTPENNAEFGCRFWDNNFTARIALSDNIQTIGGKEIGNYVRVCKDGNIIFQAHAEFTGDATKNGEVQIVVDIMPDKEYLTSPFEHGLTNLYEWYDKNSRTVTVSWEDHGDNISKTNYIFEYYVTNGDGSKTKTIVREVEKTDIDPRTLIKVTGIDEDQKITWRVRQTLGSGNDITGDWFVYDPKNTENTASTGALHLTKAVLADVDGLDAWINEDGKKVEFSWNKSSHSDVKYILEYRVGNETAGWGDGWHEVKDIKSSPVQGRITILQELGVMPQGDKVLQWRVTVVQDNGAELLYSRGKETISEMSKMLDGTENLLTDKNKETVNKDRQANELIFNWTGNKTTEYLFEYELNGTTTSLIISGDKVTYKNNGKEFADAKVVYENGKVNFSFENANAVNDIAWRVRASGESATENRWQIYTPEILPEDKLATKYAAVTDPISKVSSYIATLSFESNDPGRKYRLEYMVKTGTEYSNPVAVEFVASDKKYFSHVVKDLTKDQQIVWRVTTVNSDGAYEEWSYYRDPANTLDEEAVFENVFFCDRPTDAKNSVPAVDKDGRPIDGSSAVVTLEWQPGENTTYGVKNYVVEFFQAVDMMKEADITNHFETKTVESGAYSRLEVTNNEITLTGLKDNQYIYWRVRSVDNHKEVHKSDWTMGDPFRVALEDKTGPMFNEDPMGTQDWVSMLGDGRDKDLMDAVLTWSPAEDDKAGVKEYEFSCTTTNAADMEYAEYYYSIDEGAHWIKLDVSDGKIVVDHLPDVKEYQLKIASLKNADYNWSLKAFDYQGKASATKTGKWEADTEAPKFKQNDSDYMLQNPDYKDITVTMAGGYNSAGIASLTPEFTWTPADDGTGSGVKSYVLTWTSEGETYSITIDATDLQLKDNKYTWQLDLDELIKQNHITNIANGDYKWTFYAEDYVGNKGIDQNYTLTGEWFADTAGPEFKDTTPTQSNEAKTSLIDVSVTWKAADDFWTINDEGSGVAYYTLTYWQEDSNGNRINEVTETIKVDPTKPQPQYTYSTRLTNGDYKFEISATDLFGNDSVNTLTGEWKKNADALAESFKVDFALNKTVCTLSWSDHAVEQTASGTDNYEVILYGVNGSKLGSITTNKGQTATGTITIGGETVTAKISYAGGTYTLTWENNPVCNVYSWDVIACNGKKVLAGSYGTWSDLTAPTFNIKALKNSVVYTYKKDTELGTLPMAEITVSINNKEITETGSGIAKYRIEWGTSQSGIYDNWKEFDVSNKDFTDCLIIENGVATGNYKYRVIAIDYAGNESVAVEGAEIVADKLSPWFVNPNPPEGEEAVETYTSVSGFKGKSEYLEAELTWDAAEDDYRESGDKAGCGIKSYIFTCTGGGITETITIVGDDFELYDDKYFENLGYKPGSNLQKTYTISGKFNNNAVWNIVYSAGKYKLSMNLLPNSTYTWTLDAVDYVGNSTANTSKKVTGSWLADNLGPVEVKKGDGAIVSEFGLSANSSEGNESIEAKVVWSYSADQSLKVDKDGNYKYTFYDPRTNADVELNDETIVSGKTLNDGSGIKTFTFSYKGESQRSWNNIVVSVGQKASDNNFVISYSNNVYTALAKSIAVDNYQWKLVATDYVGNQTVTTGTWNANEGLSFVSNETDVLYEYNSLDNTQSKTTFTWSKATHPIFDIAKYEIVCGYTDASGEFVTVYNRSLQPGYATELDDDMLTITVTGDIFSGKDGVFKWKVVAYDSAGKSQEIVSDKTITVDTTAPQGEFSSLGSNVDVKEVDWDPVEDKWLNANDEKEVKYYLAKAATVTFTFENTFTDANGVTYEVRTYGKSEKTQEEVNMHSFTSTSSTLTLSKDPGMGVGYLMNLPNNEVFWDVRAIDGLGNATDWVAGNSFKLVDRIKSDSDMYRITDKTAPSAPGVLTASDSIDDGKLNLVWGPVDDAFGMDHYDLAIYDAAGSKVLKTFTVAAKDFEGKHYLNPNDLVNGSYQFAVRAIDCAGNKGAYSAKYAFTYDVIRPDFDIDSVTCTVVDKSAVFSWDAMTDNVAAGTYSVVIKRGSIIEVNQVVTDTSFIWENIQNFGTYTYTITALDADGNESASVKNGNFVIENAVEASYKWSDTFVCNTVGNGCKSDTWRLSLGGASVDGEYAAAKVTLQLRLLEAESGVDVVIRDNSGACIDVISINGCSQWTGVYYWNEEKIMSKSYTVEVVAHDASVNTGYILSAAKEEYTDSNILDNSYEQARGNAAYRIELNGNSDTIMENEWLGFSDDRDFRQITVESDGTYSFDINDSSLKMTLWQEIATNELTAIAQGTDILNNVDLRFGATYYLEIERPDTFADAGYDYSVEVACSTSNLSAMNQNENKNNNLLAMA